MKLWKTSLIGSVLAIVLASSFFTSICYFARVNRSLRRNHPEQEDAILLDIILPSKNNRTPTKTSTTKNDNNNDNNNNVVLDMLTIGSQARPSYYQTQMTTFATHAAVRQIIPLTEANDTETSSCAAQGEEELTMAHVEQICDYCRNETRFARVPRAEYIFLKARANLYFSKEVMQRKANPAGWLCAQQRPIAGFYKLLRSYSSTNGTFPDYLVVMDDDTWIHMPRFVDTLHQLYPADIPYMVAGCRLNLKRGIRNFKFPYGGWSYVLTRAVLQALVQPQTCAANDDNKASSSFCAQLARNAAGERDLFVNGMSVLDLLYTYTFHQRLTQVDSWNTAGYCMNSEYVPSVHACFSFVPVYLPVWFPPTSFSTLPLFRPKPPPVGSRRTLFNTTVWRNAHTPTIHTTCQMSPMIACKPIATIHSFLPRIQRANVCTNRMTRVRPKRTCVTT